MVETKDLAGYRVGRVLDKMGLHGQDTSELFFEGVKVPVDSLLGGVEGKGMHQLMHDLPYERTVIAVGAVGAMEGGIDETLKYVRERKTFGQPVWNYQNTRFKLAELASIARIARVFSDRCVVDLVAESWIPKRHPWPSGGPPTCSRRCWTSACSCMAVTAT